MGRPADLTRTAIEGYEAPEGSPCPYMPTSDSAAAWNVGHWMKVTGRTVPRDVCRSRGCTMHANDMLLHVQHEGQVERLK